MNPPVPPFSFWETVSQDAAHIGFTVDPHASLIRRLLQVRRATRIKIGFACVFWLRVNQFFVRKKWPLQSRIYIWRQYRFANDISPYADIGPGLFLPHPNDVIIGASAKIGKNACILNGVTLSGIKEQYQRPRLGDNVVIYTGAKVIKPVEIGDNCIIGAMSLCNENIPANSMVYGIPPNVTVKPRV